MTSACKSAIFITEIGIPFYEYLRAPSIFNRQKRPLEPFIRLTLYQRRNNWSKDNSVEFVESIFMGMCEVTCL